MKANSQGYIGFRETILHQIKDIISIDTKPFSFKIMLIGISTFVSIDDDQKPTILI